MGNKINLTVDALDNLFDSGVDDKEWAALGKRLMAENKTYWIYPYPGLPISEGDDDVHMIVNCAEFTFEVLLEYATIYLESRDYVVSSLTRATEEEAFADTDAELDKRLAGVEDPSARRAILQNMLDDITIDITGDDIALFGGATVRIRDSETGDSILLDFGEQEQKQLDESDQTKN